MNATQRFLLVGLVSVIAPVAGFGAGPKTPVDAAGRPLIMKRGTVDCDLVETTPVVFRKQVYRFEWVRPGYSGNNSDIDFCEEGGRLLINYSWGNQEGTEFLAEATFAGTEQEFLHGWFPPQEKR